MAEESILAGYRGRLSRSDTAEATDDVMWFASEKSLGESAEAVAYALRAFIASEQYPRLEHGSKEETVQVLNVEVSADHHETGGGRKTISALLRRRPKENHEE